MTEFNLANIPAHLLRQVSDRPSAAAGISTTLAPARITYRGKEWRLIDKDGVESEPMVQDKDGVLTPENGGKALDVVIVGWNEHASKIYYDEVWNPEKDVAPACFSDNGVAPSERARLPQSPTCATCRHNVFGSAINPSTGKGAWACGNVKKIAVVRYYDDYNTIYALGIPGASLKGYANAIAAVEGHGIKVEGLIWRISFNREAAFPQLMFQPVAYLDAQQMVEFEQLGQEPEVRLAVGADDKPMSAAQIEMRKQAAIAAPAATTTTAAPGGFVHTPRAAAPVSPNPQPTQPPAGLPDHTRRALATMPRSNPNQPDLAAPATPPKRRGPGRPTKNAVAAEEAARGPTPPPIDMPEMPPFLNRRAPASPADLPPATPDMDDAVSRAMGVKV